MCRRIQKWMNAAEEHFCISFGRFFFFHAALSQKYIFEENCRTAKITKKKKSTNKSKKKTFRAVLCARAKRHYRHTSMWTHNTCTSYSSDCEYEFDGYRNWKRIRQWRRVRRAVTAHQRDQTLQMISIVCSQRYDSFFSWIMIFLDVKYWEWKIKSYSMQKIQLKPAR